jgi:hypothetical protein
VVGAAAGSIHYADVGAENPQYLQWVESLLQCFFNHLRGLLSDKTLGDHPPEALEECFVGVGEFWAMTEGFVFEPLFDVGEVGASTRSCDFSLILDGVLLKTPSVNFQPMKVIFGDFCS